MSQMLRQKSLRTLSKAVARSFPVQLKETLLQERWCLTRRGIDVLLESLKRRASPEDWPTDTKSAGKHYQRYLSLVNLGKYILGIVAVAYLPVRVTSRSTVFFPTPLN